MKLIKITATFYTLCTHILVFRHLLYTRAIMQLSFSFCRRQLDESMQPLRPYEKHDTLRQFIDHDRHVLRFYCYWDDTDNMFGDPRHLVLHYFLADDTIEIREIIPPNAGRDAVPMFLKR